MSRLFAGLDTVRVLLNCAGFTFYTQSRLNSLGLLTFPNGIKLQELYGRPYLELSIPSFLSGVNTTPATHAEARRALTICLQYVDEFCVGLDPCVDDLSFQRIDVAKDFWGVTHISAVLRALELQGRRKNHKAKIVSAGDTSAETLSLGPKRSLEQRLYDKSKECRDARPDTLRSEFEIRKPKFELELVRDSIGTIDRFGDMTDEKLDQLGKAAFNKFGCDRTIVSPEDAIARIRNTDLSDADQRGVLLTLFMDAHGHGNDIPADRTTAGHWRRLIKKLAMTVDLERTDPVRLDWEAAQLVTA